MTDKSTKKNPYDWINPIHNRDLFAARSDEIASIMEEIQRLEGDNPISPIIAIIGERRVGKTSLLLRINEICKSQLFISVIINVDDRMANDIWEFWKEIYYSLFFIAENIGIKLASSQDRPMGFHVQECNELDNTNTLFIDQLKFIDVYQNHLTTSNINTFSYHVIRNDLNKFKEIFKKVGYNGIVIIFDEAHILLDSTDIKQYLRNTIQQSLGIGIIFSGETILGRLFTETSEPFFGQANIIRIDNFIKLDDITECALLPLNKEEIKLINPMTINYLAKLSRGKPNQIRLICHSIYKRFLRGLQDDLNISVDVLDDVLDELANVFRDHELKDFVNTIQKQDSVNLEILYNITRYPNWQVQNIINLDESFRGESKSNLANERRKRFLESKKQYFTDVGLMEKHEELYQLSGGEFLSLYLRFFFETHKYGKLSKRLILGKGPPTIFGEITEKLIRSLAYKFGQDLELQRLIFHQYQRDFGHIFKTLKRRFDVLQDLMQGKRPKYDNVEDLISECFSVCELIGKEGYYYLLCISVRNRDNPRELIQVELYFCAHEKYSYDSNNLTSIFNLLNQQADQARILIEGYDGFLVKLPDLSGLLEKIGLTLNKLSENIPFVQNWWLTSIQHAIIKENEEEKKDEYDNDEKSVKKDLWISLYEKGEVENAEFDLIQKISQTEERNKRARMYNDLGYIRSGQKLKKYDQATKDLQTALDLHFSSLQLTLSNLSYLDIKSENYEQAIEKIETALLLSLSPIEFNASYLRLIIPEFRLGFKKDWEQHPANVIEASYINMAYALIMTNKNDEAKNTLLEGLQLFPSSIRIKHALARFYLFNKQFQLAIPIYQELADISLLPDEGIKQEVRYFDNPIRRRQRKPTKRKNK